MDELARITTNAARSALADWSPSQADSADRLAKAIGEAVAAGIRRHEEFNARHTAMAMAGLDDADEGSAEHWQV